MRILMLTDFYPPIVGGVEQHVHSLSNELAARGHQVAVATLWHEGLPEYEVDQRVPVYRVRGSTRRLPGLFQNAGRQYAPPFPDPEAMRGLRRVIARTRPQVVHAHNWMVHSFLPLKARSKARLVVSLHEYSLVCAKKDLIYAGGDCPGPSPRRCVTCVTGHYGALKGIPTLAAAVAMGLVERRMVDLFLPVSRSVAEGNRLAAFGAPFEVIPNFIPDDIAGLDTADPRLTAALPDGPFLLFVGALGRHKGVDVLLDAYAGMEGAPPLVLIGAPWVDTPASFPANVQVFTNMPRAAVMEAWRRSLLGLVPSTWADPCPTVVMEAMATGTPLIASRVGGIPDLVADGETGLLVPAGDVHALRQAMTRLITEGELRSRLGEAARGRVRQFMAGSVVPRIERAYESVLKL